MAFDSGLLSQIANPQMPDIAGALDFRQKRLQEEQQRQKDAKMKELFSQSVLPNLREGSVQYEMAKEDPERFIAYSKAMGVPVDKASMLEQQSKDVYALSNIIDKNDPQGALQFAQTLIAEREGQGLNADREKKWLSGAMEEFNTTGSLGRSGNAIKMMNETMNGDLIAKAKEAQRKADIEEREMKVKEGQLRQKEKEMSMGGGENAGVQSSNILDDGTVIQVLKSGETRVVDPAGNALSGQARADAIKAAQNYGAEIQSARAGGRTAAAETAKGITKYKDTLFDSINNGNRTLNKYEMAIEQIDKGAESGPVMKMLPSLQDSTLLVDTIRKDIGMEIVGSGVLGVNPTDADVKLAMEVAIPEGLRPDVLKKEIKRRAQVISDLNNAQREYYRMLDSGMTKGDILKAAEEKRTKKTTGASRFKIEVSD